MLRYLPETWDQASGENKKDYRQTRAYQYALRNCTLSGLTSEVATHPHRQFFGVEEGQFGAAGRLREKDWQLDSEHFPYGLMPIDEFLVCQKLVGYQPHIRDIPYVRRLLCTRGLPVEVAMSIIEFADYTPRRKLKVPHDPLHRDNGEELAKYLEYCWQLVIRCDMMGKALGMDIPWQEMVSQCILSFWGCKDCYLGNWYKWEIDYETSNHRCVFGWQDQDGGG